ncbi:MAG TPA: biotin-dependent carboxyltransferase family protein [Casimicrobiaceae bacterium]|nr:biotin-dependent carboxyltransferase family protein [Casimicrobiaceae bacterium]
MTLRVLRSGMLATVQDLGRPGMQHLAIVPGGAMDAVSHLVANALVGNVGDAATLEIALAGPDLAFECDALVALHGARFEPTLDAARMPVSRPVLVKAGAKLRIGRALAGTFGYLAVAGGIDVPPVLHSRSTYLPGAFGGWRGKAVTAGGKLPLADDAAAIAAARYRRLARGGRTVAVGAVASSVRWSAPLLTLSFTEPAIMRVLDGVHAEAFDDASREAFLAASWRVLPESNRMGYRLSGPALALAAPREIVSQPVCLGTVQVPSDGQPIVLMADRQTTGGYPRIAEVASADVPRFAQVAPGTTVRFERVPLEAADAAREQLARRVRDLTERLRWEFHDEVH